MLDAVNSSRSRRVAATLFCSAAGGWLFESIGMPAGWLSGGMLAVVAASLAGLESEIPDPARWLIFLILGLFAGSGATPETLDQINTWPASFTILIFGVLAVTIGSYLLLNRFFGWDGATALFASLPGALSFIMATVEGLKVDIRKVAVAQSIRVLILVEIFPLAMLVVGQDMKPAGSGTAVTMPLPQMLALLAACTAGSALAYRLRFPGGIVLGSLLVSAGFFVTDTVSGGFPQWLVVPGMVGLGAIVGVRFRSGDRAVLPTLLLASVAAFALALLLSGLAAWVASLWLGIPLIQTLLAFAPGALEAVVILAFAMQVDPAYVAAHHVVRFFALALVVPILARRMLRLEEPSNV
ncbi:MAG TPA: AbrB family transcriptional regulator [Afifellaceae bacterium]|nr:AbrB family transcriptional regulator [Afifellaceae bacterium]